MKPLVAALLLAAPALAGCAGLPDSISQPVGRTVTVGDWEVHVERFDQTPYVLTHGGDYEWVTRAWLVVANRSAQAPLNVTLDADAADLPSFHGGPSHARIAWVPEGEVARVVLSLGNAELREARGVVLESGDARERMAPEAAAAPDAVPARRPPPGVSPGNETSLGRLRASIVAIEWVPPEVPEPRWPGDTDAKPGVRLSIGLANDGDADLRFPRPLMRFTPGGGDWLQADEWTRTDGGWASVDPGTRSDWGLHAGEAHVYELVWRPDAVPAHPLSGYLSLGPDVAGVPLALPPPPADATSATG